MARYFLVIAALSLAACQAALPGESRGAAGDSRVDRVRPGHEDFQARVLAVHNRERAAVGARLLVWDPQLAAGAAAYGPVLARAGRLLHSNRETRPGQSENLWRGSAGAYSVEAMVGSWAAEKSLFQPGLFPNNSRNGNWLDVSHYTTMIWPTTTHLGCALHRDRGSDFLICRYSPSTNRPGVRLP